jgi:hypothetical protein
MIVVIQGEHLPSGHPEVIKIKNEFQSSMEKESPELLVSHEYCDGLQ